MSDSYLQKRGQTWYARVRVPPRLLEAVGRGEVIRTLGTRDKKEAQRLVHSVVGEIKASFVDAEQDSLGPLKDRHEELVRQARDISKRYKSGEYSGEDRWMFWDLSVEWFAKALGVGINYEDGNPDFTQEQCVVA